MKFSYGICSLLLLFSINFYGQSSFSVSGMVQESNGESMAFANVLLLKSTDSTLVKGTITQEDGSYIISSIKEGDYTIMGSFVGYRSGYSKTFNLSNDYEVETIVLNEGEQLDAVVVEASKPLYQQKVDRMVINVENSIVSAGGTALEVLERSPGVLVNRQSNSISISGKEGVEVMINGKRSYMPASSLVQMLEGMSADNIATIELITTPPANFDAEGNAGFINIVLKKRTDLGLNGNYSFAAGYGDGVTNNDNINFNYRKNKINIFGSYSFLLDKRAQTALTSREYTENNNLLFTKTTSDRDPTQRNHNIRLGLDFQSTAKTIMGVILDVKDNRWSMDAINNSFDAENGIPTSYVILDNNEINHRKHFFANYNIKHSFSEDKNLSFDIDYLNYRFNNPTNYSNSFFDENNNFLSNELLRSGKITSINTWVSRLDYSDKISDNLKMEVGVKGTKSDFENDVSIENFLDPNWVIDPTLTNKSNLDESILAGYGSIEYNLNEKTSIKAGLRYEHTDSELDTDTQGTVVDRNYGIWFPSIFLSNKINDSLSMNLSYSKRITRPNFNDLAPFVIFLDPNTFITGNASLQPAISNTYKYDINYKSYFLSVQYTDEDSSIARFQERIDEDSGLLVFEADNLEYTRTLGFTLGFPFKLTYWWRTQNNFNYFKQKIRTSYNNAPIELDLGSFSVNSTHFFKISQSFSAELSGFYNGPRLFGASNFDEVYGFNLGFQKKFSDTWGTLKFSVTDIFNQVAWDFGTNSTEQNFKSQNTWDLQNRTFTLTYTRNFGNKELKSSRNRETGSEEERRRVNN